MKVRDLLRKFRRLVMSRKAYLLKESRERYSEFGADYKQKRLDILRDVVDKREALTSQADELTARARDLSGLKRDSAAEQELDRREAVKLRREAYELFKKVRAFSIMALYMRLIPWIIPCLYKLESKAPTLGYYVRIAKLAHDKTRGWEMDKILEKGALVSRSVAKADMYTQRERRIVQYGSRHFLIMMGRSRGQPDAKWSPEWATEALSQMTDAELQTITNNPALAAKP